MLDSLGAIGSLGEVVERLLAAYQKANKGKLSTMRAVLTEMHLNLERIDDYFQAGNPIRRVIGTLAVDALREALFDKDFDFNTFERKKVHVHKLFENPEYFYLAYDGWSTERLFNQLYEKIARLQEISREYPDNPHYRLGVRLENIRKMMVLLLLHLRDNR
ncbi:MAG: hypothetical protein HPY85_09320 [Anaerolineae bacterium]|nr:hypothetical protein [Anaerolineae bacterium]